MAHLTAEPPEWPMTGRMAFRWSAAASAGAVHSQGRIGSLDAGAGAPDRSPWWRDPHQQMGAAADRGERQMHGRGMRRRQRVPGREGRAFHDPHQAPGGYGAARIVGPGLHRRRGYLAGGARCLSPTTPPRNLRSSRSPAARFLAVAVGIHGDGRASAAHGLRLCPRRGQSRGSALPAVCRRWPIRHAPRRACTRSRFSAGSPTS